MNKKPVIALAVGVALVVIGVLIVVLWPENSSFEVRTSWLAERPTGPVRLCGSEDVTKARRRAVKDYNDKYSPGSKATYSEGSFLADEEHDRYVRSVEEGSDDCDVILLDVIYMKEFAAKHLLYDMTPYLDQHDRRADFDSDMLQTVEHDGRLWGVPKELDVGVLYYRADKVPPPRSWQEVYERSKPGPSHTLPGLRIQFGPYEGLTVILLELAYAAGADQIITENGKTADLDQPPVRQALGFLHDAFRERVIPAGPSSPRRSARRRGTRENRRRRAHSEHGASPPRTPRSSRCLPGGRVAIASAFSAGATSSSLSPLQIGLPRCTSSTS
jgi:multiple sugar transport system substrate-binding protein